MKTNVIFCHKTALQPRRTTPQAEPKDSQGFRDFLLSSAAILFKVSSSHSHPVLLVFSRIADLDIRPHYIYFLFRCVGVFFVWFFGVGFVVVFCFFFY